MALRSTTEHTIDELFRETVERYPDRPFLHRVNEAGAEVRSSYREASVRVAGAVERLQALGLESGQVVAMHADDLEQTLYFMLACFHAGLIVLPVPTGFSLDTLMDGVERTEARAIFTQPEKVDALAERGIRPLVWTATDSDGDGGRFVALPERPDLCSERALEVLTAAGRGHDAESFSIILPTSGTTGRSKLPVLRHRSLFIQAGKIMLAFGVGDDDQEVRQPRMMVITVITHGLGATKVCAAVRSGGVICAPRKLDVAAPLEDVRALDPDTIWLTPRILRSLHRQHLEGPGGGNGQRLFGPSTRSIGVSGAAPDADLMLSYREQGVDMMDIYGCSEAGIIAYTEPGRWEAGIIGRPFPGNTIEVSPDGELLLRTPEMVGIYWGDEIASRQAFVDGFYRSGDAGLVLPDGRIAMTGRLKDVFNTPEGSNIYPTRIEVAIEGLPWVSQVVLLGDQLPFIGALIVVRDRAGALTDGDGDGDGFLPPGAFDSLYARARAALAEMNGKLKLEFIEKVRRFLLFDRPLPEGTYTVVTIGKIRRDRQAIDRAYAGRIKALYGDDPPAAILVPDDV